MPHFPGDGAGDGDSGGGFGEVEEEDLTTEDTESTEGHDFMKRLLLIVGIAAGMGSANLLAEPRIACDEATFDFGSRDASEVVEHTFKLKNSGTTDLVISAIRPACGCTAANLTRQTIPPGESAELSTRLTLAGRSGELHKTILVESNDPANPALQLALVGKTSEDFVIQPSVLVLRKDSRSQSASGAVQIRATDGSAFEIGELVSASGKLKLRADPMPDGKAYQISANFDEDMPAGEHSDQITISTNLKGGKPATVGAIVLIPSPISVAPAKIVLEENPQASVSRTIILKAPKNEKIEIARIDTPDSKMTTQVQPLGDFGIRVTLGNIAPTRELDSKFIGIHLVSGQIIEIPIQIQTLP